MTTVGTPLPVSLVLPGDTDGLSARPLMRSDAAAVTALMADCEQHDVGEVLIEEADIVGDWQRPAFDLASQSVGVLDGERLVAYAEVYKGRWADAAVDPAYRGTRHRDGPVALDPGRRRARRWQRSWASPSPATPLPSGCSPPSATARSGPRGSSRCPPGRRSTPQPVPEGYVIREPRDEGDLRATWTVNEDAFLEWSDRERATFEEWAANVSRRPGYQPWQLRLMVDRDDQVVGMAFVVVSSGCAYVDKLAVRRDERGKGLARALLVDAFEVARAHGGDRSELSTDSRTGALGLYEKVGMQVTSVWRHWAADVTPEPVAAQA